MQDMQGSFIKLRDAENAVCMTCSRSVIGICPHRGAEPDNPEKTTCITIQRLRQLQSYEIKAEPRPR